MQTVGCDGGEVLVCNARQAVLVDEVPITVGGSAGQQCKFVVGKRAVDGVFAGACVARIISFQCIGKDDDDVVAREFLYLIVGPYRYAL